jgi:hypothetical protein
LAVILRACCLVCVDCSAYVRKTQISLSKEFAGSKVTIKNYCVMDCWS